MISSPVQSLKPPVKWIEAQLKEHSIPFFTMEGEHKLFAKHKTECWYIFTQCDRKNLVGEGAQTIHTFAIEIFSKKIAVHGWTILKSKHRLLCAESEVDCLERLNGEQGVIKKLGHYFHRTAKGVLFRGMITEYHPRKHVVLPLLKEPVIPFAIKIIEIVSRINQRGIIHRDIKPDNILISDSGEPVIADFGFACFKDSRLLPHVVGTPAYFGPELYLTLAYNDPLSLKNDVWATAVTVYRLFFNAYPSYLTVDGIMDYSFGELKKDPLISAKILVGMKDFYKKIEPQSDMLIKLKKMFAYSQRERPELCDLLPIEIQQEEVKPLDKPKQIVIIREDDAACADGRTQPILF